MPRWSCLALLLAATSSFAQLPPDKAAKTFTVSAGLEFKLWASEPLFVNPTCMDIDHKGRVWVCESVNYRNKLRGFKKLTRPEGDRIVILEDSSGKGVADKATTFYQHPDLLAPLGIAVAKDPVGPGYKVYVCQSPDILVFEDKDGDGKADGPPTKLLTGFKGFDHDHGVHGILIGPDRKLYFSVGDAGVAGLQSSDGKGRKWTSNNTDCRAGTIWRCDMDGKNLELIAHNFRNEYEPCVDSFGNVFVSDNDDDGNQQTRICHVLPGGNYGYHPRGRGETHWHEEQPGVVPKILRTYFGSPTGMCVYEGTLLPKKYWGQPLHTDAGPRHVRAYHLTPKGASYEVEREDIVSSTDNWYRPSDVCVAPDGSVFVSDWYDPGVGGHGMGDIKMGRVYRLAPVGHKYAVPKVDLETNKGILDALGSPALSVRWMAMAALDKRKNEEALALLETAAMQREDSVLRARALWQLARVLGNHRSGIGPFTMLFNDKVDPRFPSLAIRMAKDQLAYSGAEIAHYVSGLDEHYHSPTPVLREGLLALRDKEPTAVKDTVYKLMRRYDGKDRFYLAAIGIAVGHHDEKRREVILADFDKHFPEWNDKVADLVWELRPPKTLPRLGKLLKDGALRHEQRARIVDILATSNDPAAGEAVLAALLDDAPPAVRDCAVENLKFFLPTKWQKLRKSEAFDRALTSLLAKPATRGTAVALVAAAGRDDKADQLLDLARSKDDAGVRRAAIAALGELPGDRPVSCLLDLLGSAPEESQPDVTKALGEVARRDRGSAKALKALQALVSEPKKPGQREAAVLALTAGHPGSRWLIDQHAKGKLPADVAPLAGRILRNSPFQDLQNRALSVFPAPGKLDPKSLPPIPVLAARHGDVGRGKALLAGSVKDNLQCLKCHTVRGVGGQVGPDLSMIGKKASRENLIESILYPSKAIADQYVQWVVQTSKGVTVQGLLVEETPDAVVLRDAEGRDTRIRKAEIESRDKSPKSIMPEDTISQLREEDLLDLVEYLLTLKTPALAVDSWSVAGPFDNGSGMEGLDRVFAPEKGVDLAATYEGKHGQVGWRTVKAGATGYVDLAAFHGKQAANSVSYLTREIDSPAEQDATVVLGTDDGAKLWVNGELIFTSRLTRAASPEQDRVNVRLKKGVNRLLLKINNGDGPHGFYFTVLTEQEVKAVRK
ncbi:MAG: PVC-type heme-binding CxxCH protein [Gemmataceae bacterium]